MQLVPPIKRVINVLIVDDDHELLALIKNALESEPYKVYFADNVRMAANFLKEFDIDVILSNNIEKSDDEFSFLREIKDIYPHVFRILLTRNANFVTLTEKMKKGIIHSFVKEPFDTNNLRFTVSHVIERKIKKEKKEQERLDGVFKDSTIDGIMHKLELVQEETNHRLEKILKKVETNGGKLVAKKV